MRLILQGCAIGITLLLTGPVSAAIIPVQTLQHAKSLLEDAPEQVVSLLSPQLDPLFNPTQRELGLNNQAMAHKLIASALIKLDKPQQALAYAQSGSRLLATIPQSLPAAEMQYIASQALWRLDRRAEAMALLAEVSATLRAASSPLASPQLQQVYLQLSRWRRTEGDLAGATIAANLAVNSAGQWRNPDSQLEGLALWADLLEEQGLLRLALNKREEHQRASRAAKRWTTLAESHLEASRLHFQLSQLQSSKISAQAAADLALDNNLESVLALALIQLGKIALLERQPQLSLVHLHNALEWQSVLTPVQRGRLLAWISTAYLREGQLQQAERYGLAALKIYQDLPQTKAFKRLAVETLLAQTYMSQQRLQKANVTLQRMSRDLTQAPHWLQAEIVRLQAELQHLRGNDSQAYKLLRQLDKLRKPAPTRRDTDVAHLEQAYRVAFRDLEQVLSPPATRASATAKLPAGISSAALVLLTAGTLLGVLLRRQRRVQRELALLRYQSTHDPFTDLLNFRGVYLALAERLPKARHMLDRWYSGELTSLPEQGRYAMALFKLEQIEQIVQSRGYHFGARLEQALGNYLRQAIGPDELVGVSQDRSYGFIAPCGATPDPVSIARRIQRLIYRFEFEGQRLEQPLAVGIISYPLFASATKAVNAEDLFPFLAHVRIQAARQRDQRQQDCWSYLRPLECFPGDIFIGDPDLTCQAALDKGYLRLEHGTLD